MRVNWFVGIKVFIVASSLGLCMLLHAQTTATPDAKPTTVDADFAHFTDTAASAGIAFQHQAYHTAKKYLLETMGSGVAVFDYDNDGLLDIFFANGAPISDPTPKGTVPVKSGPKDWNRMYHQKKDGTFEDVTEKSGLKGVGYSLGTAVGDYDNDGFEDLFVTSYGGNHLYHTRGMAPSRTSR